MEKYPVKPLPSISRDEKTRANCEGIPTGHTDDHNTHPSSSFMKVKEICDNSFCKTLSCSSEYSTDNASCNHTSQGSRFCRPNLYDEDHKGRQDKHRSSSQIICSRDKEEVLKDRSASSQWRARELTPIPRAKRFQVISPVEVSLRLDLKYFSIWTIAVATPVTCHSDTEE